MRLYLLLLFLSAAFLCGSKTVQAADTTQTGPNFVVTGTEDHDDGVCGTSDCTLREAINAANSNSDASEITFASLFFNSPQVIAVSSRLDLYKNPISIVGPGAALLTVKESGAKQSIIIFFGDSSDTKLSGITISGGHHGFYSGSLNSGTASISNCIFRGNITGLYNNGTTTVTNCAITNSSIGIYNLSGTVKTINSVCFGNETAVSGSTGTTSLINCTLSGNNQSGVGRSVYPNVTLQNSIAAGNTLDTVTISRSGHNFIGGTATEAGLEVDGNGKALLKDNGGPTPTIALVAGSPAINGGDNALIPAGIATDQRGSGSPRIKGGIVDIGAFEADGLSINNITVTEGNPLPGGMPNPVTATFTVTLSQVSNQTVTVDYATTNPDRYIATAGTDYIAQSGTLTFEPGEITKNITVTVNGDALYEGFERFRVFLFNPTNAITLDNEGACTITDDEALPSLSINSLSKSEGDSGITNFVFTVSLSVASAKNVSVNIAMGNTTSSNAATVGEDFTALTPVKLTFTPGQKVKTVIIRINGDTANESSERFSLKLSNSLNAPIVDSEGVGNIINDDVTPTLVIDDVALNEGNDGTTEFTFTVSLSAASGKTVVVKYATAAPTKTPATADRDYAALPLSTLTFAAGETTKQITVQVTGDTELEGVEKFVVRLSNASNAVIIKNEGVGSILNDDAALLLFEDDAPSE